jgi:hypothetical protein
MLIGKDVIAEMKSFEIPKRWGGANLVFVGGILSSVLASVIIGYKEGKVLSYNSDAISDNLLLSSVPNGVFGVQATHTHISHWPLVILQNILGYNSSTNIILAIISLLLMFAFVTYLALKFSYKNLFVSGLSLIIISGIVMMGAVSANEYQLSMHTMRNWDLPLLIIFTYWLFFPSDKRSKIINKRYVIRIVSSIVGISILMLGDLLFLYALVIGCVLYFSSILYLDYRKGAKFQFQKYRTFVYVVVSVMLTQIEAFCLALNNIVLFDIGATKLPFVKSLDYWFRYGLLDKTGLLGLLNIFSVDFFGKEMGKLPFYVLGVFIFCLFLFFVKEFFGRQYGSKKIPQIDSLSPEIRVINFLIISFMFGLFLLLSLVPREESARYYALLPFVFVLMFCYYFRKYEFKHTKGRLVVVVLCICLVVTSFFGGYQRLSEKQRATIGITDSTEVLDAILRYNIKVYQTEDYWNLFATTALLSDKYGYDLVPNLMQYSLTITREDWLYPTGDQLNSAIGVSQNEVDGIKDIYGEPENIVELPKDKVLLIYNYDIRTKYEGVREFFQNMKHKRLTTPFF